jgi:hypothetical protein
LIKPRCFKAAHRAASEGHTPYPFGNLLALFPKLHGRKREEMIGKRLGCRGILHDDFDHQLAIVEEGAGQNILNTAFFRGLAKLVVPIEKFRYGNFGRSCRPRLPAFA